MNLNNILNDEYYTFLEDNHNVAFYSLSIGLEEYFETYHRICIYLSEYEKDDNVLNEIKNRGKAYITLPRFFSL